MSYQGSATSAVTETGPAPDAGEVQNSVVQSSATQDYSFGTGGSDSQKEQNPGKGEQLKKAVSDLNKQLPNSEAIFGIHEETNRVTIKIVDKSTREVIKEYPPEETLDMIAKVWEVAGILVDEKL